MGRNNKPEKIVETEPVVIEEEAIVDSTEIKEDEVIEVEAPEVIVEEKTEETSDIELTQEENGEISDETEVENSDGDVKTDEPSVQAPVETEVELEILIAFSDKYTNVDYEIGDVITVNVDRAKELLDDCRKLVKKR